VVPLHDVFMHICLLISSLHSFHFVSFLVDNTLG